MTPEQLRAMMGASRPTEAPRDTIDLYASPEEVRWSVNGEPCEGPEQALLSVEAPLVRVVVSAPDTPDFTVEGLTATPFALRALEPLALWNTHKPPRKGKKKK